MHVARCTEFRVLKKCRTNSNSGVGSYAGTHSVGLLQPYLITEGNNLHHRQQRVLF